MTDRVAAVSFRILKPTESQPPSVGLRTGARRARVSIVSINFDRAATVASIERMKQIVANLKATVVIQHDMRDIGKLPAFPAAAK